jgi:AbrB family looped-hinge helix DNA binding protein
VLDTATNGACFGLPEQLVSYSGGCILTGMMTTLSTKGQTVIPESIREQARLKTGDKLDVGYINGLVVMRKRVPLTPSQARALILSGRELPAQTAADEARVQEAVAAVRRRRPAA